MVSAGRDRVRVDPLTSAGLSCAGVPNLVTPTCREPPSAVGLTNWAGPACAGQLNLAGSLLWPPGCAQGATGESGSGWPAAAAASPACCWGAPTGLRMCAPCATSDEPEERTQCVSGGRSTRGEPGPALAPAARSDARPSAPLEGVAGGREPALATGSGRVSVSRPRVSRSPVPASPVRARPFSGSEVVGPGAGPARQLSGSGLGESLPACGARPSGTARGPRQARSAGRWCVKTWFELVMLPLT